MDPIALLPGREGFGTAWSHSERLTTALSARSARSAPAQLVSDVCSVSAVSFVSIYADKNGEDARDATRMPEQQLVISICASLDSSNLVEILKWPFCVGEAERIVLDTLEEKEKKNGASFGDNLWKFVAQAPKLGFSKDFLEAPIERPSVLLGLKELDLMADSGVHRTTSTSK